MQGKVQKLEFSRNPVSKWGWDSLSKRRFSLETLFQMAPENFPDTL